MPGSKALRERIENLVAEAPQLSADVHRQKAWLTAAQHAVVLVCPLANNPYHLRAREIVGTMGPRQDGGNVSQMAALMSRLLEEIELGLLTTIENRAIAVTLDDFLDHGAEYLKQGRKNEAGVIAGIVFEDTIRRICRTLDIGENGVALETLIAELAKRDVLTALKGKARSGCGWTSDISGARPVGRVRDRRRDPGDRVHQGTHSRTPRVAGGPAAWTLGRASAPHFGTSSIFAASACWARSARRRAPSPSVAIRRAAHGAGAPRSLPRACCLTPPS